VETVIATKVAVDITEAIIFEDIYMDPVPSEGSIEFKLKKSISGFNKKINSIKN
jgi:hypothetical protein